MIDNKLLHFQGNTELLDKDKYFHLAIVGSRSILPTTKIILENLFDELATLHNLVIVSGGMYGVDILAHKLSFQHKIGTIIFLPSGIENFKGSSLYKMLNVKSDDNYLLVSKYSSDFIPKKYSFLERNKQMVSFSDLILVAQSAPGSGSFFSGNYSLRNNKKTFAVPFSPLDSQFAGNNILISKGARIFINPTKFILEFSPTIVNELDIEDILALLPNTKDLIINKLGSINPRSVEKVLLKGILGGRIFLEGETFFKRNDK